MIRNLRYVEKKEPPVDLSKHAGSTTITSWGIYKVWRYGVYWSKSVSWTIPNPHHRCIDWKRGSYRPLGGLWGRSKTLRTCDGYSEAGLVSLCSNYQERMRNWIYQDEWWKYRLQDDQAPSTHWLVQCHLHSSKRKLLQRSGLSTSRLELIQYWQFILSIGWFSCSIDRGCRSGSLSKTPRNSVVSEYR